MKRIINFLKLLLALPGGTVLYDRTTDQLLISCACSPWYKRIFKGLNLKTELHGSGMVTTPNGFKQFALTTTKLEITGVKNLRNYSIIGKMK